MKKFLFAAFAVLAFGAVNAQGFKGGVHVGLPIGDVADFYSFAGGVDLAYTWEVADNFTAGVTTGYSMFFGKTVNGFDVESAGFIPLAGTASYKVSDNIFLGADLGYALGVAPTGNDGGFLYQPKVGYAAEKFDVYAGYRGISVTGGSFDSINLGFSYKF
ncbi:MAG: hypothetical protein KGZ81_14740 [Flavobacteriales bacterium]|nr:hypothetical protein [Flavobacteriales bacterium]